MFVKLEYILEVFELEVLFIFKCILWSDSYNYGISFRVTNTL